MKRTFKPGDEIVIVEDSAFTEIKNGDKGILKERNTGLWNVVMENGWTAAVYESEMELSQLAESPLWKALS